MQFNKLIPELVVSNINKSISFYVDLLGFKIAYERKENNFAFLELDGSQIMIHQAHENDNWSTGELSYPYGRGINLQIEVNDVDELYNKILNSNYQIFVDMKINEYKQDGNILKNKEFLVLDPDGYLLRFFQDV